MTDRELMQQALNALEQVADYFNADSTETKAITALRQAIEQAEKQEPYLKREVKLLRQEKFELINQRNILQKIIAELKAQPKQEPVTYPENFIDALRYNTALREYEQAEKQEPEFTTHVVENACDWSEWVCPDPKSYLMKCCDCGLVHEVQFKVVRYKSETEREECDTVDDPNVQAVFRMRRSEQWSSEDMAHRSGGLPIEQTEKQEPVAWFHTATNQAFTSEPPPSLKAQCKVLVFADAAPPPRQPLTDEEIETLWQNTAPYYDHQDFARAIEAAHGIKGEA